jgi:hypothetical protein
VLQDEANGYACLIPAPARSILGPQGADVRLDAVILRWWAENGHTPFFRSCETARAVRRCIRQPPPV